MMTTRSKALTLALGALTLACARTHADKAPARPVRVESVRSEAAAAGLRYSATIQPREQVSLAFKVGGYVREMRQVQGLDGRWRNLQQGDPVTRGMVLARIHSADYEERVNQARATLAEAEAGLIKALRARRHYASKFACTASAMSWSSLPFSWRCLRSVWRSRATSIRTGSRCASRRTYPETA